MTKKKNKLLIIDSNALIHRAFHALPELTDPDGRPVQGIYGYLSLLFKAIDQMNPTHIIAAFDLPGKTIRHEQFKAYKETRSKQPQELYDQFPRLKELLEKFKIPIAELEKYEADDVIGTLAKKASDDTEVIILTGDLDTLQLVDDNIVVSTFKKGLSNTVVYDDAAVKERFGGLGPDEMNDYKGLKGDSSDNIPGVPRIGEKTAIKLINKFPTLEVLYRALEDEKTQEKLINEKFITKSLAENLIEHKDQALFSRELATIYTDLDIEVSLKDAQWPQFSAATVREAVLSFGFKSLAPRIPEAHDGLFADHGADEPQPTPKSTIRELKTTSEFKKLAGDLKKSKQFAFYIGESSIYIANNCKEPVSVPFQLLDPNNLKLLGEVFMSDALKVSHDVKRQILHLYSKGVTMSMSIFDTMIGAWILAPDRRSYEIDTLLQIPPDELNEQEIVSHICDMYREQTDALRAKDLDRVFSDLEMPLLPVLAAMEIHGIGFNPSTLSALGKKLSQRLEKLRKSIYKHGGGEFNINSPKQIVEILFTKLSLPTHGIRKTPTGAISTNESELKKLKGAHPIVDDILEYRELFKLVSTYIDTLPKFAGDDGRIHTTFLQTGTVTGRVASENPNVQNIPIRTEWGMKIREAFTPAPGHTFVSIDYSQIDLRVAAHISGDSTMVKAFKDGADIHAITAAKVFGIKEDKVTSDQRRQAKAVNFGILYGLSSFGLSQSTGMSRPEAQEFIDAYFKEFPKLKDYIEETREFAKKKGYVETLLGRKRYMSQISSGGYQARAAAEREAVNMPVQGTSADIMKLAMIKISDELLTEDNSNLKDWSIKMLLQIHDDLLFEIKDEHVDKAIKEITKLMESAYKLDVPLKVDVKTGHNWGQMNAV